MEDIKSETIEAWEVLKVCGQQEELSRIERVFRSRFVDYGNGKGGPRIRMVPLPLPV